MLRLDDFLGGLILLEIVRSNTEALATSIRGREGLGAEDYVPDELRRPVRVSRLAKRLGIPDETTRRQVARLVEKGLCVRVRGGVLVPSSVLAREAVFKAISGNVGNLQRLFSGLAQLGVLSLWDEPPTA